MLYSIGIATLYDTNLAGYSQGVCSCRCNTLRTTGVILPAILPAIQPAILPAILGAILGAIQRARLGQTGMLIGSRASPRALATTLLLGLTTAPSAGLPQVPGVYIAPGL